MSHALCFRELLMVIKFETLHDLVHAKISYFCYTLNVDITYDSVLTNVRCEIHFIGIFFLDKLHQTWEKLVKKEITPIHGDK